MDKLFKYELPKSVVEYLARAVEGQQLRGSQNAKDMLAVLDLLNDPKNKEDLEKETLESLKQKYEPIVEKKEEKK